MDLNLHNHVAVVTGGASGIGRATAEAFADEGAQVAIWDLAADKTPSPFRWETSGKTGKLPLLSANCQERRSQLT